jgi:hypothetical protein
MTPKALYSGARMALRLARQCQREATCDDRKWHVYMLSEAKRHRERAAYYLRSRKWIIEDIQHVKQH